MSWSRHIFSRVAVVSTAAAVAVLGVAIVLAGHARAQDWSAERERSTRARAERYEEVLLGNPLSDYAFDGLVREYGALGGLEALVERWSSRVAERPDEVAAVLILARLRAELEQPEAALALVERAADLGADGVRLLQLRGRLRAQVGDEAGAVSDFEAAAEGAADPTLHTEVLRELGDLHVRLGQPDEAIDAYRRIADVAPRDRYVRLELAHLLYEAGLPEAALEELQAAVELAGTDTRERADALREVALLEEELERYADAVSTWTSVRELTRPGSWLDEAAREGLLRTYRAWGRLDELLARVEGELGPRTRDRWLLATRARLLAELERDEQAVAAYREALERGPGDVELSIELATLLRSIGRFDEARAALEEALEQRPDDFEVLTALAELLVAEGEVFDASYVLRAYQERHWAGVAELWQLFGLYQRIGDWAAADRVAVRVMELSPDDQAPLLRVAEAAFEDGRPDEALATLDSLRVEGDPDLQLDLIEVLRRHDQQTRAEAEIQRARERFPDNELIANLWLQSMQAAGPEASLAAAREVLLMADRWDVVVEAFDLYWSLLVEARLTDWAVGHYAARFDAEPTDPRLGRMALMLQIVEGQGQRASETLTALRAGTSAGSRADEWVLATLRRWPRPEALPLLRRLGAADEEVEWRYRIIEAQALAEGGRVDEARGLLDALRIELEERPAGLYAVGEAFQQLPDAADVELGCSVITRAYALDEANLGYALAAIDCLAANGKELAAYRLAFDGLGMVREVAVAEAFWERLIRLLERSEVVASRVSRAVLAEGLRSAFEGRRSTLREWLEERLHELGTEL